MMRRHRLRGLTLWEILFVVVVLLFLAAVILPALSRVQTVSVRYTCGTNLSGLGKTMLIYANDYGDRLPRAGGPDASWAARTPNWKGKDRAEAYGIAPEAVRGGQASVSASLYLLVRYMEVTPREFLCLDREGNTERGATVFDPCDYDVHGMGLTDLWDFGPNPPQHVSYAYHQVYGPHKLTTDSNANTAVAADRNPWMDSPFDRARDFSKFTPNVLLFNGTVETALNGNAVAHRGDGQHVLFLDTHVNFEKRPFCGVDDDNIYTSWDGQDKIRGRPAQFGSVPADPNDSLLVNDPAVVMQNK